MSVLPESFMNIPAKKEDSFKTIAIHAKRARGLMVDQIITNRIDTVEPLTGFSRDGYSFNSASSSTTRLIFDQKKIRPIAYQ